MRTVQLLAAVICLTAAGCGAVTTTSTGSGTGQEPVELDSMPSRPIGAANRENDVGEVEEPLYTDLDDYAADGPSHSHEQVPPSANIADPMAASTLSVVIREDEMRGAGQALVPIAIPEGWILDLDMNPATTVVDGHGDPVAVTWLSGGSGQAELHVSGLGGFGAGEMIEVPIRLSASEEAASLANAFADAGEAATQSEADTAADEAPCQLNPGGEGSRITGLIETGAEMRAIAFDIWPEDVSSNGPEDFPTSSLIESSGWYLVAEATGCYEERYGTVFEQRREPWCCSDVVVNTAVVLFEDGNGYDTLTVSLGWTGWTPEGETVSHTTLYPWEWTGTEWRPPWEVL